MASHPASTLDVMIPYLKGANELIDPEEFTTKSLSKVELKPYAVFAKFTFPPCNTADEPTYATVQTGRDSHMNLNSDLVYINHSCEPSLVSPLLSSFSPQSHVTIWERHYIPLLRRELTWQPPEIGF